MAGAFIRLGVLTLAIHFSVPFLATGEDCRSALNLKDDYLTIGVAQNYVGENEGKVPGFKTKYLSPSERQIFRLQFRDGLILDAEGRPFHTTSSRKGRAIFVMTESGEFYATTKYKKGLFHHSSLVAGSRVAAAGQIIVDKGRLKSINDWSGHYLPSRRFIEQAIDQLRLEGIVFHGFGGDVEIEYFSRDPEDFIGGD